MQTIAFCRCCGVENPSPPKGQDCFCKATEPLLREVSISTVRHGWKLCQYARFTGADQQLGALKLGQGVRLFHAEAGAWMQVSAQNCKHAEAVRTTRNEAT